MIITLDKTFKRFEINPQYNNLYSGAITKPWETQQKIATLVSDEFFYQGDLEKEELHLDPIPMMDRDYKDKLPAMQVH